MSFSNLVRRFSIRQKQRVPSEKKKKNNLKRSQANTVEKNFWDINGFNAVLERCDNG